MTNTCADIAIDAFRRQEQQRRLLAKAEARTAAALKVLRTQPAEELNVYFTETEKIRLANDMKDNPEVYAATMIPSGAR